ncbi:DUF2934 domain-containing protein [Hydrogenophaga sp. PBL-H3]|uniref:DUF2934 domain-containing protein n=1 Tax=Hydrogenophaga sp. PBL-H3 TaxID=434010 RepID=UPI0013202DF6|nr:DUF2934 domain-containing protein [Hydrogenophaga sp. PBL-H3]QHE77356.1 DUF2934 domain-containing protein [Hydrogenophaga sp. PBL-H3]QHE81780.1 DUF2934 domain-containing protein [Hydrogenophaga sp. PBL-H3]
MKQTTGSAVRTRAVAKRPPMAVMAKGDGHARADGPGFEPSREGRIHEAAYALYEARGCVHGHDVDDWLAAEAAVAREASGAIAGCSALDH